jgi:hypothetical protein
METYSLNTTNPIRLRSEDWSLTVRSSSGLDPFYLSEALTAMTQFRGYSGLPLGEALLPSSPPRIYGGALDDLYSFEAVPDLDALAIAQGVRPIEDIDELVADFWPEDESVEDFIAAVRRWRYEGDSQPN